MKKIIFILMVLLFNSSLLSCTEESLAEMEADLETFATEGEGEGDPEEPEGEPPVKDGE